MAQKKEATGMTTKKLVTNARLAAKPGARIVDLFHLGRQFGADRA
jgi:hypothetical protein